METIERAANIIENAEALLFTAGAGMGFDSGLPEGAATAAFGRRIRRFGNWDFRSSLWRIRVGLSATHILRSVKVGRDAPYGATTNLLFHNSSALNQTPYTRC